MIHFYLKLGVGPWIRFLHLRRFVRCYVTGRADLTILDAGFGQGDYIAWLGKQLPDAQLIGYDLASTETYADNFALARAKIQTPKITLHRQDLLTMDDHARFDVVYSVDVLEHIPNNTRVFANIYQALKPGGLFYLAMPYDHERKTILPDFMLRRFRAWADEEHIGEMRSLPECTAVLQELGFEILEARYTFHFFARLAWELEQWSKPLPGQFLASRLRRPILNVLSALEFVVPAPSIGNILVIARK